MSESFLMLRSFFPPDFSPDYLIALIKPLFETLAMTFGAMTLAFILSLILAVAVGLRMRGARALVISLSLMRAIPDLTLAILCVILFGIGPGAGMMALVLYYTASVSKVWADLLQTAPQRPIESLAATGAAPLQIATYGLLPLTQGDVLNYGAFAFECALRSSIIVGAVGGGGIGAELVGSLAAFDFRRASTLIILVVIIIALLDHLANWTRKHPRWLIALIPFGLGCVWIYAPNFFAYSHTLQVLAEMLPPTLNPEALAHLPWLIWETVWMALVGTFAAAALALPAAFAASRRSSPWWLRIPIRRLLEVLRTIPEVVMGLVLVAMVGIGPLAGAWALGIHTFGSLGRLFADALDNTAVRPQQALASTGASPVVIAAYATLPLALSPLATHLLFRLEWNLRVATVLGLIGAGGIGQALYEAQQLFFYNQVLTYVIVTGSLVLLTDYASARMRARLMAA